MLYSYRLLNTKNKTLIKSLKNTTTLIASLLLGFGVFAQSNELSMSEYDSMKLNGSLNQNNPYTPIFTKAQIKKAEKTKAQGIPPKASGCITYPGPDTSYTLAMQPNDDGSSQSISIPFVFCFYGDTVNALHINNNGNITFSGPLAAFSPTAFPSPNNQIISPFWGDVDTRGNLGEVWYKVTPTYISVLWHEVGYFNMKGDKRNSFQLIITDGADPIVQGGNVAFVYGDMNWTTGDAGQATNGFGSPPGTAGANKGDNISYFLLGQFDHPGTDYDGPTGNPDGIDFLDNKSFYFDVCSNDNIAPVPNGLSPCDTFRICSIGDTADFPIIFLSPEQNQQTSISVDFGGLTSASVVSADTGNVASVVIRAWGDPASIGHYNITVTATDDFSPPGVTSFVFTVHIDSSGTANFNPVISPTIGCDSVEVGVLNGPYDSYLFADNTQDPTKTLYQSDSSFAVTVEKNGCFKRLSTPITVMPSFDINLKGDVELCTGIFQTFLELPDSANFENVNWFLGDPAKDTIYSNTLDTGSYMLYVEDTLGICTKDTSFTIINYPALALLENDSVCGTQFTFDYNIGGSGEGFWTFFDCAAPPTFSSLTDPGTTVSFSQAGEYNLVFNDTLCGKTDTSKIIVGFPFTTNFFGNTFYCPGLGAATLEVPDSNELGQILWSGDTNILGEYLVNLIAGTYTMTTVDTFGVCTYQQNFQITTQPLLMLEDDRIICDSILEFTINSGGSGSGFWSELNGNPPVNYDDITALNQTIILPEVGVYVFVYQDGNCPNNDTVVIDYRIAPGFDLSEEDWKVCAGETESVLFEDSIHLTGIDWQTGNPAIDTIYSIELGPGMHSFTVFDSIGCRHDSTFVITEFKKTELTDIDGFCGDSLPLLFNSGEPFGIWEKIEGPGTVTIYNADSINPDLVFSTHGQYKLTYTFPECDDVDTLDLDINFFPYAEVAGHYGCAEKTITFEAFDYWDNIETYQWSTGGTNKTENISGLGEYTLETANECGTHTTYFNFDGRSCYMEMPNVFTPNDDGKNEFYYPIINDPEAFTFVDWKVLNRWGHTLYESNTITEGWDGTWQGNPVTDGTYYFLITVRDLDGLLIEKEGFFHLIRNGME